MNLLVDIKILPYHISLGSYITKISSLSHIHAHTHPQRKREGGSKGLKKYPMGEYWLFIILQSLKRSTSLLLARYFRYILYSSYKALRRVAGDKLEFSKFRENMDKLIVKRAICFYNFGLFLFYLR